MILRLCVKGMQTNQPFGSEQSTGARHYEFSPAADRQAAVSQGREKRSFDLHCKSPNAAGIQGAAVTLASFKSSPRNSSYLTRLALTWR